MHENARFSNTYLAKKLKIKRETVAYRIKRMMEQDFLHGHLTLLDHRRLGFKNYMVYLKLKTLTTEKELLDYLFNFEEISRLKNCSGSYDIQIVFSVKSEEEFSELFEKITNQYHQIIQSYDILEILEEDFLGLSLVLSREETENLGSLEHKGSTFQKEFEKASQVLTEPDLDDKDKLILEKLKLDGSLSLKELSGQASLAPLAVENRIKKMIQSGVIKRFMSLASLSQLGYQSWKVFFKFKNLNKSQFLTFLRYHPNILWYMKLLGRWDYQFTIYARDNAEFHRILDEIRTEFADNIINYDSIIVFNQFKYIQRI
ncbi:Lrp/AsnC family transcriptional regulator [archaeon]|nr:Lrp/AsnC family transcriptional regulator [archaeon]